MCSSGVKIVELQGNIRKCESLILIFGKGLKRATLKVEGAEQISSNISEIIEDTVFV